MDLSLRPGYIKQFGTRLNFDKRSLPFRFILFQQGLNKKTTNMNRYILHLLIFILAFCSGCAIFRPDERELSPRELPKTFSLFPDAESMNPGMWWREFHSTELDNLIQQGFENNFDLRKSYAVLKQSRAQTRKQSSYRFPDLSANAGYDHTRTKQTSGTDSFSLGLAASYEMDLWGRVKSLSTADILSMNADAEDYRTMAMSLAASVCEAWVDIVSTRREIAYVNERISVNTQLLSMLEQRFEKGMASAMDVLNQKEALYQSLSMLTPLEAQETVQVNTLSLLLGKPPGKVSVTAMDIPDLTPFPGTGIPSDLLAMRPDIRAAGMRLKSADWQISAAKAARLPSLSLSAYGGYSAENAGDIFDNWIMNLAANLTGPIFDAGRKKADVDKAKALAEQRLAAYEGTVFQAVTDVENAIIREIKQKDYVTSLGQELDVVTLSYDEATRRYLAGQDSYLAMQEKMLNIQSLEISLIRQKGALFKYRIALYRSLGGNWTFDPVSTE